MSAVIISPGNCQSVSEINLLFSGLSALLRNPARFLFILHKISRLHTVPGASPPSDLWLIDAGSYGARLWNITYNTSVSVSLFSSLWLKVLLLRQKHSQNKKKSEFMATTAAQLTLMSRIHYIWHPWLIKGEEKIKANCISGYWNRHYFVTHVRRIINNEIYSSHNVKVSSQRYNTVQTPTKASASSERCPWCEGQRVGTEGSCWGPGDRKGQDICITCRHFGSPVGCIVSRRVLAGGAISCIKDDLHSQPWRSTLRLFVIDASLTCFTAQQSLFFLHTCYPLMFWPT